MLGIGRIGGVAGALVGAALMGLGWQFGSVFSLLAVPALISAVALVVMAPRLGESGVQRPESKEVVTPPSVLDKKLG
jgi:AAHS family 4-hydroxybenzoate transporter-like MFS transporter